MFSLESILNKDKNRSTSSVGGFSEIDAPTGIRTPVVALKGLRPSPLDDGGKLELERADFIIPLYNGQAFCLFFFFRALTEQTENIDLFTVNEDTGALCFKVRDQDCGEHRFIDRDKVSGFIRNDGS